MQQELGRTTSFTPSSLPQRGANSAQIPAANLTYAYAGFGAALGILFGVATAITLHQAPQTAQVKTIVEPPMVISEGAGVVHAGFALPEEKDMGSVNSRSTGLRGHLTTSWSEKLNYRFQVEPADAAQRDAFAQTVSDPQQPISINLQLKAATGQVLCGQQVVVKYDDTKAAVASSAKPGSDVFQTNLGSTGKVESISSQGTMGCTKEAYDSAAYWSFSPQFPDLREQAKLVKRTASAAVLAKVAAPQSHPSTMLVASLKTGSIKVASINANLERPAGVKAPKVITASQVAQIAQVANLNAAPKATAPSVVSAAVDVPAVEKVEKQAEVAAEIQKPAVFHFQIEGDDEIVDFDAGQKSLETSAGKSFVVSETLVASNVAGWLDEQANIHYRCDENSSCTLSLPSAGTVLHATMRSHHGYFVQPQTLSMNEANPIPVSPTGNLIAMASVGN